MSKPYICFLEGCQGCGKTTLSNLMRENLGNCTLISLTGLKDKGEGGCLKTYSYHMNMLRMTYFNRDLGMSYVFARSPLSEYVYCNLDYKPYSFQCYFDLILKYLEDLTKYYDIYFINLKLKEDDIKQRLDRNKFVYNDYSVKNSIQQIKEYDKGIKYICNNTKNIKCFTIENNDLDFTFNSIKTIVEGLVG